MARARFSITFHFGSPPVTVTGVSDRCPYWRPSGYDFIIVFLFGAQLHGVFFGSGL